MGLIISGFYCPPRKKVYPELTSATTVPQNEKTRNSKQAIVHPIQRSSTENLVEKTPHAEVTYYNNESISADIENTKMSESVGNASKEEQQSNPSTYMMKRNTEQSLMYKRAGNVAEELKNLLSEIDSKAFDVLQLKQQLESAVNVLDQVVQDEKRRSAVDEDDLSQVDASAVPDEVRDWLASTFTRKMSGRKDGEKPKFKSIVNALRAGMFVERMFRRISGMQALVYPPALIPHLQEIRRCLDDWAVDMFSLNDTAGGNSLKYVVYELLNRYDILSKFKVPVSNLLNFLDKAEAGYSKHNNPYHNLIHAADITQTCHYFMLQTGLMNWLTDLEIFAVLIAACCHDVEHTGTTNNFHINTKSEYALLYNDKSVLENHHASFAFRTMLTDDSNILANVSRDDFFEFRHLVVEMILATDMSFHFSQIKTMKNVLQENEAIEKNKALSLVLHAADISHPAKPWNIHYRWTMLLLEEFFRQGDRESELGLPYSPLCDRHTIVIPDSQVGFIDYIINPIMEVTGDMLERIVYPLGSSNQIDGPKSEDPSKENGDSTFLKRPWNQNIKDNRKLWKAKSDELKQQKENEESNSTLNKENVPVRKYLSFPKISKVCTQLSMHIELDENSRPASAAHSECDIEASNTAMKRRGSESIVADLPAENAKILLKNMAMSTITDSINEDT